MWRTLWERHRGAFCVAVGMICFLAAGILVRGLPSVREHLSSLPSPSGTRDVRHQEHGGTPASSSREADSSGPSAQHAQPTQPASEEWFLYVTGSVRRPGVYRLPPGARTVHLVDAAGGLDGFADPVAINLAQPLADGMHVHVPQGGASASGGPCDCGSDGPCRASGQGSRLEVRRPDRCEPRFGDGADGFAGHRPRAGQEDRRVPGAKRPIPKRRGACPGSGYRAREARGIPGSGNGRPLTCPRAASDKRQEI